MMLELLVIARMMKKGIIERTEKRSSYQAHFFLLKKADKNVRPITNYKLLSEHVPAPRLNLPNVFQIIRRMRWHDERLYFVKIYIKQAFYNIPLHLFSKYVTQFIWAGMRFQYLVLPLGMSASPYT